MAKENKPESAYAGRSKEVNMQTTVAKPGNCMDELNIGVGNISKGNVKGINPYGTGVMRGYGAATKGRKISGKMG